MFVAAHLIAIAIAIVIIICILITLIIRHIFASLYRHTGLAFVV